MWNILVSVLGSQKIREGLCRAQGNLETPRCKENPGNGDQAEHFRRDPNGILFFLEIWFNFTFLSVIN